jgi:hypothetical protein
MVELGVLEPDRVVWDRRYGSAVEVVALRAPTLIGQDSRHGYIRESFGFYPNGAGSGLTPWLRKPTRFNRSHKRGVALGNEPPNVPRDQVVLKCQRLLAVGDVKSRGDVSPLVSKHRIRGLERVADATVSLEVNRKVIRSFCPWWH